MITTVDKALVALIMGIIGILNLIFPGKIGIDATTVTAIIAFISPILIWLIPNLPKDPAA